MVPHEVLQTQVGTERSRLSRAMGWLAFSLGLPTAGVYLWFTGGLPSVNPLIYFVIAIGLIFGIQAAARRNQTLAAGLLAVFSVVEGLSIASVVNSYLHAAPDAIGSALLGTVGIFLVASAAVYLTSIDMAAWGQWLLGALLIGIVVSFATLIFHFPISTLAIFGASSRLVTLG